MKPLSPKRHKTHSSLKGYLQKRNLNKSKEPKPKIHKTTAERLVFVIQKHAATRLHYDFRLELDGVLKSWAVPKGISLNPKEKRLAIMVEDHPFNYKDFEGVIEEGYGKGSVIIWDQGTYRIGDQTKKETERALREGIKAGSFHIFLEGEKIKGEYALVRIGRKENEWLLIKVKDHFVSTEDITNKDRSVVSNRPLEELGGPRSASPALQKAPKAKRKPSSIKPMLALLVDEPFDHDEWIFELKLDGFRAIAELNGSKVELYSRNLKSFNERFPLIINDLIKLKLDAVLDGEVVALDEKGVSKFQLLQNQQSNDDPAVFFYVFDILHLNGKDLRKLPLIERKAILKNLLKKQNRVRYLDYIEKFGKKFLKQAEKVGCEGIIGKKKNSIYQAGERTGAWVKIKTYQRQEALICGFTEPKQSRKNFGALILGVYEKGSLRFIGNVGGGFTEQKLKEVIRLLEPTVQKECPFKKKPPTKTAATWVHPQYLCEVRFSEWTNEGSMRHPVFLGLREDKPPKEVIHEAPVKTEKIVEKGEKKRGELDFITHVEKIYWPKEKITKGAVLQYYAQIAPLLLPHLKDRPQSLKRFPDGIEGESFFQKNLATPPPWVSTIPVQHTGKTINYLLIQDVKSLLYAANLGCIELHPWFSRYQKLEFPDFLVFDLDPEAIAFDHVVETALVVHEILESIAAPNYCKTTGATGLHIYVPLQAKYTYEQAKEFALIVASIAQQQLPSITSLERQPKKRQKRVYIDCFQNNFGQTLASPYSLRARIGAPVATPLEWKEVKAGIDPGDYNLFNIFDRTKKKGDLFKPVLGKGLEMKKSLKLLEEKWLG